MAQTKGKVVSQPLWLVMYRKIITFVFFDTGIIFLSSFTSYQLKAKAEITAEASYYNPSHDAWEPILEPVVNPNDESYSPWTLQAEVSTFF